MNIDQSRSSRDVSGTTGDRLTQAEAQIRAWFFHDCGDLCDLMDAKSAAASNQTDNPGPPSRVRVSAPSPDSEQEPEEPRRMMGDFDGSSNVLWTIFKDEAKNSLTLQ